MRGLFSTHFGILLLLAVLEATAIHDNDHDKALETPNSSILTWRKIQQQHQQQSQGDNSNQRRVQEGNNDDRDDQQGNDEGSQDIDFDDRDEYVDSSREIDCNLVPRYCEEKGIDQGHGEQSNEPGPIYPIAGGNSEDNKPDDMTPRNLISLRVSVGLTNADRRSQSHLARYTARVITSLLDRYSPFMVKFALPGPENRVLESFFEFEEEQQVLYPISQWDSPESKLQMLLTPKAEVAGKRTRKNQRVLLSKRLTLNGGSAVTDKNHGESTEEQEPRHQRQLDHDNLEHPAALGEPEYLLQQYGDRDEENDRTFQNTDPDHGIGDTHTHNRILSNDNKPPSPARLFHWHTEVAVQSYDQDWMVVQVSYTVYKNKEKPILNPRDLQNITGICVSVLNATIVSGHFLDYLQQLILHEDEDDNSQDPSGSLGDNNGSTTWNSEDDPNDDNEVYLGVAIEGEEFSLADGAPPRNSKQPGALDNVQGVAQNASGSTYPTPLQLGDPWGTCEWLGLVLFLVLVFSTTFLTYFSVWIKRRQSQQQLWGTQRLTETGVGDLLNVGWRYQEGGEQLFLQVFDKGKLGYNDDNSMLMGGVVEQTTTPTTLPSSTVTTTTPEQ